MELVNKADVNHEIAEKAGELRAKLLDQGRPIPNIDLHIAVTALINGFTLVTHNQRHFSPVPGLILEDWLAR